MIASLCTALFLSAERVRVPTALDPLLSRLGCNLVGLYRRTLSARSGRRCLFRVTCSAHAVASLRSLGWNRGVARAATRLRRCGGAFSVSRDTHGHVVMVAADGVIVGHDELAEWLLRAH